MSSSIPQRATRAGWNDLATELKLAILEYRLISKEHITPEIHNKTLLPLALTSTELHRLAMGVYFKSNTFLLQSPHFQKNLQKIHLFHSSRNPMGVNLRQRIRSLQLNLSYVFQFAATSASGVFWEEHDLGQLLIPNDPHPLAKRRLTNWQMHFTNLRSFKLVLEDNFSNCPVAYYDGPIPLEWLDAFHTCITKDAVGMDIEVVIMHGDDMCDCNMGIAEAFRNMLMGRKWDGGERVARNMLSPALRDYFTGTIF
ncbi:hypothetical protein P280DRAFT_168844 [Massarina eburnea CBS 473.64]|uniref:Uncharacterized protein n=1 Tax=Massarina eburnea CBS 473.64 TaxID=1395130 RepID=A0A6A6RK45_9PLEO|nr:hypothetical protein P280DRAFT_168844 [Massarina eburnea CBS 473.64]